MLGADRLKGSLRVVGLGASAGGIKPLQQFFAHVPQRTGIGWVVVLHLSPDYDSKLAEVLQAVTSLPVSRIDGPTPIEPDHVYVVPPNKGIEIVDDALIVKEFTVQEQRRSPIDVFFRTLADGHDGLSACVVLSGSGSDGSAGLKRIKEHGGLTLVQNPVDAEHPDMPANAISTGRVDLVLPVSDMPAHIIEFFDGIGRIREQTRADDGGPDSEGIRQVLAALRRATGHDFSTYKHGTIQRRLERRLHAVGLATLTDYAAFLKTHPDEATALMKELLISVTNFFRDGDAWRVLEQQVVPRLFAAKQSHDRLRVWVPGCATGEEAYSLAMLLAEYTTSTSEQPAVQLFGTDLDTDAIAIAREGLYSVTEVADVSEDRLRRFFHKEPAGYRIRRELRELVLFAHHNVISDPPFSHLDLISCRNLLIYLNKAIQARVLETFHFALRPSGYLFLGTSESPEAASNLFIRVDDRGHLYSSNVAATRSAGHLKDHRGESVQAEARTVSPRPSGATVPAEIHQRLLEQYAPPSVIITDDYEVIHVSESAGRYLQVSGGEPSRSLLQLVRHDLQADLRTALYESARDRRDVEVAGITVNFEDGPRFVDMVIRPSFGDGQRAYFLVIFRDEPRSQFEVSGENTSTKTTVSDRRPIEDELVRMKAHLRATVEQYEMQAEAAQAANEELQAVNEELRSAAEELETSKEELQSVNEELTTVNQELKIKIEELGLTNNDFQNFINSTDIGTIFLDRSFRVKLFTSHAQKVFNLIEGDVGRNLSDITSKLRYDDIHQDVRRVLDTLQTIEHELQTHDGRWHLMRVRPYRTTDNRIDGIVLTFHDITERREAEFYGREADERLRLLAESAVDYAIFTKTDDGTIASWNTGAERLFGYTADEIIGRPVEILFTPEDRAAGVPGREMETARRTGRAADERYHLRKDGTRFYVSGVTTRLGASGLGFAKIARDLSAQREADEKLQRAQADLERRVKERTEELESEKARVTDLLGRVVSAQEDERSRIARDLHDSLGQQLTALRLTLERHDQRCSLQSEGGTKEALALTASVSDQVDFLARELRPAALEDLGLAAALPRFIEGWSRHAGITAEFHDVDFRPGQLSPEVETTFYRVAQEALNNIAKHAHATRVDVVLSCRDGQAVMIIEDDGSGFDPAASDIHTRGIGLLTMRERVALVGGSLEIESEPGRGTSMYVRATCQAKTS